MTVMPNVTRAPATPTNVTLPPANLALYLPIRSGVPANPA
jgi:hypothetical protein